MARNYKPISLHAYVLIALVSENTDNIKIGEVDMLSLMKRTLITLYKREM